MKAITCTQCGAALENVSDTAVIVICEYCGARMMMPKDDTRKPDPPPKRVYPKVDQNFATFEAAENEPANPILVVGGIALALLAVPVLIAIFASSGSKNSASKPVALSTTPAPWTYPSLPVSSPPVMPDLPVINYQTKVQWTGPNDMEHFDEPEIDLSKAESQDAEQIKKTIFKNRQVTVRVTINTDGEVTDAVALSGHPLLKESCVAAAKASLFSSRSKPTTRVLTYYFRIISD